MAQKAQQIKKDAIVSIDVNSDYYIMVKGLSMWLVQMMVDRDPSTSDKSLQELMQKNYSDIKENDERGFYTLALFLAEVEKQAQLQDKLEEVSIPEPGDDDYVAPTDTTEEK